MQRVAVEVASCVDVGTLVLQQLHYFDVAPLSIPPAACYRNIRFARCNQLHGLR